jgi:uncharacterized membrane protein
MNDFLHANIFFFITSVAVVAVTLLLVIVLWYVIAILKEVRHIAINVRRASDGLEQDLDRLRQQVHSGGTKVAGLVNSAISFAVGRLARPPRRGKRRGHDTTEDDAV